MFNALKLVFFKLIFLGSDYMDTNFRLLRAEIFSAIQRGIQDLKSGTLDYRDMNCYFNVTLAGYYFTHSQLCLALRVCFY